MKRFIAIILTVVMLSALLTVAAYAEVVNDTFTAVNTLTWSIDTETKTLTIGGTGAIPAANTEGKLWVDHASDIEKVIIESTVTGIEEGAFPNILLTSLTVPCTLEDNDNLPTATTKAVTHDVGAEKAHIAAKDAAYNVPGNKEYWKCQNTECGKLFKDAACKEETTLAERTIPAKTDTTAPVLTGISMSPLSVSIWYAVSSVDVTVTASDNESGIGSGTVVLYNSVKQATVSANLQVSGENLTGKLEFYESIPTGEYRLYSLRITDKAGNSKDYSATELANYFTLPVNVMRNYMITPKYLEVSFDQTSCGYGGTLYGKVKLTDSTGLFGISNKSVDIYVGTTKLSTVVTGADGTATFPYSNGTPGTYQVSARFNGDTEVYPKYSDNTVTVTFTTVPATGDSYDVVLWSVVVLMAIGVNVWFFLNRKRAW